MSEIHMVQLSLKPNLLMRLGKMLRLPGSTEDGYLVHCALGELFGKNSPPVFSVEGVQGRELRVLAYADAPINSLHEVSKGFSSPNVYSIVDWEECASKPMPTTFVEGMRFRFEVKVCPVVRLNSDKRGAKKGAEVDAYLSRVWDLSPDEPLERAQVYMEWLEKQIQMRGGAHLLDVNLEGFQLERLQRRTQGEERRAKTIKRPVATLSGLLEVGDTEAFSDLLRVGIGRHRAFGFGMLKVRRY